MIKLHSIAPVLGTTHPVQQGHSKARYPSLPTRVNPQHKLERMGKGLVWNAVSTTDPPLSLHAHTACFAASHRGAAQPDSDRYADPCLS